MAINDEERIGSNFRPKTMKMIGVKYGSADDSAPNQPIQTARPNSIVSTLSNVPTGIPLIPIPPENPRGTRQPR